MPGPNTPPAPPRKALRLMLRAGLALVSLAAAGWLAAASWAWLNPDPLGEARAAYRRADWAKANELARERVRARPDDKEALRLAARASSHLGRDDVALNLFARLGGPDTMQGEDLALLGTTLVRMGEETNARTCLKLGLKADPGNPLIIEALARLDLRVSQLVPAAERAAALAKRPGHEAAGDRLLAEIDDRDGNTEGAFAARQRLWDGLAPAARGSAEGAELRKGLARSLLTLGKAGAARDLLKAESAGDPESAWLLSRANLQADDLAGAADTWRLGSEYRAAHPGEPEPSPFVGAVRCAECHAAIAADQQASPHGRTFTRDAGLLAVPLPGKPVPDPHLPGVVHTLKSEGGKLRVETKVGGDVFRAVVDYAFGSGDHGMTLVGRDEGGVARELRLSRYAEGAAWDVTTGHPALPKDPHDALGLALDAEGVRRCLFCHVTDARSTRDRVGPTEADRSIGCERCHGPGENHLKAVGAKFPDLAIVKPTVERGEPVVALCGQCHSPLGKTVRPGEPLAIRFQSPSLRFSRCFTESGGKFDCVTCHDPHKGAESDAAGYEARCLDCHAAGTTTATGPDASHGNPCPVNPRDKCLGCHMPKVRLPEAHLDFTDHHIRVRPEPASTAGSR